MRCNKQAEKLSKNVNNLQEGNYLDMAVDWFKDNDIPLYGVQRNPTQDKWTSSPKAYGNIIIDDAALGIPQIWNTELSIDQPFVDWIEVELMLEKMGVLPDRDEDQAQIYKFE